MSFQLSDLRIDIHDPELKRQLSLSTADLRFAEHLVRSVSNDKGDIYLVDTGKFLKVGTDFVEQC